MLEQLQLNMTPSQGLFYMLRPRALSTMPAILSAVLTPM